jgi:predicted RNA-binding Zn-ribbon protein involved in translation (DUF1610 family)
VAREPCLSPGGEGRPHLEVADIFRAFGDGYCQSHILTADQRAVVRDIMACRTAVLGGHLDVCTACGHEVPAYNSCRNRHCPKCQSLAQAAWLESRKERILPTRYFHVVFTLPHEIKPLARLNQRLLYDLLLEEASRTLLEFGHSRLDAQIGITTVLHTWTRDLRFHPHAHCIVTAGGLALDQSRWVPAGSRYLFPVSAMSVVFRGKFLAGVQKAYDEGRLEFGGTCAKIEERAAFARWMKTLYRNNWVVYAKPPFGGPEQVFNYIGRYTHRVGLSNRRLCSFDESGVCFSTKNGKTVTVAPTEFIRRFLLHVLPKAFVKIRHYGLHSSSNATTKLELARQKILDPTDMPLLASAPASPKTWQVRLLETTGIDVTICPRCGKPGLLCLPLARATAASPAIKPIRQDTS